MPETLTMNDTPADQPDMNADEQDSLQVAESLEGAEQPLLAGKFKDQSSLEQAYLELQKKLGTPNDEAEAGEEGEQEEQAPDKENVLEEEPSADQLTEEQAGQLFEMVGGESTYKDMLSWAGDSLSQQEVEMYDTVMADGNAAAIFFAVQALNNKYTDAVGKEGQLLTGRSAAPAADNSFRSQSELVAAMSDKRYDSDPAYRSDVMRKLENSDLEF